MPIRACLSIISCQNEYYYTAKVYKLPSIVSSLYYLMAFGGVVDADQEALIRPADRSRGLHRNRGPC